MLMRAERTAGFTETLFNYTASRHTVCTHVTRKPESECAVNKTAAREIYSWLQTEEMKLDYNVFVQLEMLITQDVK